MYIIQFINIIKSDLHIHSSHLDFNKRHNDG